MPGPSNHASKKKRKAAGTAQKHSKSSGVAGKTQGQQQRGQDAGGVSGMDSNHIASAIEGPSMDPAGSYTDDSSISANRPSTTSVKSVKSRLGTSGTGYGHDIHRHCHQHPPTSHRQSPPSRHAQDSHSRSHAHLLHSSSQSSSSSSSTCPSHLLSYPYHQQQQQPQTVGIASSSFDAPSSSTFSSSLREMPPHAQISSPLSFAPLPPPPPAPKGSRSSGTIPRDNNSNSTGHGRTKTGSLDLSNSSSSPKRGRSLVRRRTTNSRHPQVPIEPSQFPSSSHHGQPSAPTSGMQQHEPGPSHGDWNMERKPLSVAITPLLVPHHHHRPRHNFLGVGTTSHGDRSKPSSSDSGSSPSTSQILTPSPPLDHSSLPSHAAADSDHVLMAESETDSYLDYDDEESAQLFGVRVLRVVRHESARVTHSSSQVENRNNRFGDHVVVESGYESMEVEKERKQRERQRTEQARVAERVRNGVQQQRQQEEEQQEQQGSGHQTISEPDEELQSQHQATEEQVESIVSSASLRALLWPDPMPPPMPWEDHTYQYYFDTSMEERTQLSLSSSNHHHQPVYTSPSHSRSPSRTTSESYHSAYSRGDRPPSTSSSRSGSSEHDGRPRVYTHPDPDFVDAQYRSYSYPYSHSRSPSRVQSITGRSRSRSLSYSRSPPQHHRPLSRPPSPTQTHSRSASSSTGTSDWFDTCDPNRSGPRSVNFNLVDETTEEEPLDDWDKEIIDKITPCLHDPGNGVRVKDVKRFMDSYFAREPALDVPLCAEFAQKEMLEMLEMVLPEEIAIILWYNKSRLTSRICPACRRLYTLGDALPSLTPEGEEEEEEPEPEPELREDGDDEYYYPRRRKPMSPFLRKEQELSGLCSPICFIFSLFNNPLAIKPAWGHTAHEMDHWAWDQLNGPGDNILGDKKKNGGGEEEQFKAGKALCLLVRMTRLEDLGLGQLCLGLGVGGGQGRGEEDANVGVNGNTTRSSRSSSNSNSHSGSSSKSRTTRGSPRHRHRHSRRSSESEREEEEGMKVQREVMELLRGVSVTIGSPPEASTSTQQQQQQKQYQQYHQRNASDGSGSHRPHQETDSSRGRSGSLGSQFGQ